MRATRMLTCLAFAAALVPPVEGQAPRVSMDEALRLFGEHSLGLSLARAEAAAAQGAARQSGAYFNPSLTWVRERLDHEGADYHESIVGVEQRLEWPGRTVARRRAAAELGESARAGLHADSVRLAFEVRRAYAGAWMAEAREGILRAAAELMERVASAAGRRLEEGDISGYEARRIRLESVRLGQDLSSAELEATVARRGLAALVWPETGPEEIAPAEPLRGLPPGVDRQRALQALTTRSDIEAATRALAAARSAAAATSAAWIPEPTLAVGYKDQSDGFEGAALSLTVPIPLFDRKGGAAEAARARQAGAAAELDLRRRAARNDLLTTVDRYASLRSRLERVGEELEREAEALLGAAEASYADGEMTLVELLDAARAVRDARLAAASLRENAWVAYYDLLRAMGRAPEDER